MEGGNTNEYANLIRKTHEYGNPVVGGDADTGRQGLSTNVGYATGGAGCHYDFGDTTGVGFGGAAAYLNDQSGSTKTGGGGGGNDQQTRPVFGTAVGNEERRPAVMEAGVVKGRLGGCTSKKDTK